MQEYTDTMVKLLLGAAAVAALIIGGVVEIKVHPGEISRVPQRVLALAGKPALGAAWQRTFVDLKRSVQLAITRDERKKLELTLQHVKTDAEDLRTAAGNEATESAVALGQAELLERSLARVRQSLDTVPVEAITDLKEATRDSFQAAEQARATLEEKHEAYAAAQERFKKVSGALQDHLASLLATVGKGKEGEGDVAGARDRETTPTPTPQPAASDGIPLTF